MGDIRAPDNRDLAYKDYMKGMKYKEIAEKYNVSMATVKSWKTRYKWDRKSMHTKQEENKKVCIQKDSDKNKKIDINKVVCEEVKEVLNNTELTDKQRLFCIYYIKCFNATKAYQKAYGCDYITANSHGYKMLSNVVVKQEIDKLKKEKLNRAMLSENDIFQRYIDIAFSDITDYLDFGNEEVEGEFGPYTRSYVNLKNSFEVDGALISEVSQGKDGIKIKLQDKMKALQWLSDRMDLLPTNTRIRLENEKSKLVIEKERLEIEKYKTYGDEDGDNNDAIQNFIKATSMSEEVVKALFENEEGDEDGTT